MRPLYYLLAVILVLVAIFAACGGGGGDAPGGSGGITWSFVDGNGTNGINKNAAENAYSPQLTLLGSKLYATWNEGSTASQIRVAVYNGIDTSPSWTFVDGNGINGINRDPTKNAFAQQLTSLGSKLYAIWTEPTGTVYQIRVAVYNGNDSSPSWAFVDGNGTNGINKDATKSAFYPQLTALGSKLYATWIEPNSTTDQVRVAVYNGNDASPSWTFVDGNGTNGINRNAANDASSNQLSVFGSKLYAIWDEYGTASQIRVAVYNGNDALPSWTFVDGNGINGINKDVTRNAGEPQLTEMAGRLYSTWVEYNGVAYQVRIALYNGDDVSPAWTFVDGSGTNGINKDVTSKAYSPKLAVCNGVLYATWDESNHVRVALYNGDDVSPSWAFVDGNEAKGMNWDASQSAYHSQLTTLGTKLYAAWQEAGQIRVVVGK
jgi:hypothetical protein